MNYNTIAMNNIEGLENYFYQSKIWYNEKYIKPISQRSYISCACLASIFLVILIFAVIYKTFPIRIVLKYAVKFDSSTVDKQMTIKSTLNEDLDPLKSIAKVLLKNYIIQVERYNYSHLKNQLIFVNSNSSKYVFNQYYNFINIDNIFYEV